MTKMPTIPNLETTVEMPYAEKITAIVAITQLFKFYGASSKWCPIIAITIGILLEYSENPTAKGILDGVVLGAMTTGSYGVIKTSATYVMENGQKKIDRKDVKANLDQDINLLEHDDYRGV